MDYLLVGVLATTITAGHEEKVAFRRLLVWWGYIKCLHINSAQD